MPIEYLDRAQPGWFVLDVMKQTASKCDWVALMVDVDPDELKNSTCEFPALFYVHPNDHRPVNRRVRQAWFRIPGNHKNKEAAWDVLQDIMETRH
jgi:hypothetical protein